MSAAVIDQAGKLVGRVTVDAVVDFIRQKSESEALAKGGLRETEDVFAPVWESVKNRWAWLAINLVTAFIASRVIGAFEGSIEKLVALAALMPIVAGIGGNRQSDDHDDRPRARARADPDRAGEEALREGDRRRARERRGLGGILGVIAWALYGNVKLGIVMTLAMTLNLLLAAIMGVVIPTTMAKLGRDPALARR